MSPGGATAILRKVSAAAPPGLMEIWGAWDLGLAPQATCLHLFEVPNFLDTL